jgi:hypothetical protein
MDQDIQIKIDLAVEAAGAAKTVGEVRKAMKDLTSLGLEVGDTSKGFDKITNAAGKLKDKMADTKASISALSGEPIENLSGSFSLLQSKISGLDFKGATSALKGMGTSLGQLNLKSVTDGIGGFTKSLVTMGKAILTNPLLLMAAIVIGLVVAIVKLKDSSAVLTKYFEIMGDAIDVVIQAIKDLLDWIGLTNFAVEDKANKIAKNAEKEQKAIDDRYYNEIEMAKAAGKSVIQLEIDKANATKVNNQKQIDALNSKTKVGLKLTDDEIKKLGELTDANNKAATDIAVLQINKQKEIDDNKKKSDAEAEKAAKDKADKAKKRIDEHNAQIATNLKNIIDADKAQTLQTKEGSIERLNAEIKSLDDTLAYTKKHQKELKLTDAQIVIQTQETIIAKTALNKAYNDKITTLEQNRINAVNEYAILKTNEGSTERLDAEKKAIDDKTTYELSKADLSEAEKLLITQKGIDAKTALENKAETDKINRKIAAGDAVVKDLQEQEAILKQQANYGVLKIEKANQISQQIFDIESQKRDDKLAADLLAAGNNEQAKAAILEQYRVAEADADKALQAQKTKNFIDGANASLNAAQSFGSSLNSLNQAITDLQHNRLKKGEKLTLELQKKEFKRQKALNITMALINGAQGVMKALADFGPSPVGIAAMIAAGVITGVQVAAISAKQFEGDQSTPNDTSITTPNVGGGSGIDARPDPARLQNIGQRTINQQVQQSPQRVYVVETDITKTQQKVSVIESRAILGG